LHAAIDKTINIASKKIRVISAFKYFFANLQYFKIHTPEHTNTSIHEHLIIKTPIFAIIQTAINEAATQTANNNTFFGAVVAVDGIFDYPCE
jgi:hypothetical protein